MAQPRFKKLFALFFSTSWNEHIDVFQKFTYFIDSMLKEAE